MWELQMQIQVNLSYLQTGGHKMTVEDDILNELKKLNKTISGHLSHKKEIPQPYFFWLEAGIMGLLVVWFSTDVMGLLK
jgi:hypothetical protein